MTTLTDLPARGKILSVENGKVVFAPSDTTYELHLVSAAASIEPQLGQLVNAEIRLVARKLYTVPSGGGFIAPIYGPPKTVQGRVVYLDDALAVLQAGTHVVVELPRQPDAMDLANGPIRLGAMVNVVAMPGATLTLRPVKAAAT